MDLGLKGKKAIICASSRGLGRGCATALAEAGCDVIINGRNKDVTEATAKAIQDATGVKATPIIADVSTHKGQDALLAACPEPDILVNNNGGPPRKDFRDMDRAAMLDGVTQNFVTPLELIQRVVDGMAERGFGRIVNITSLSVYMPIEGLDLSSGARAGLTAFLAGVTPQFAKSNVTINNLLPGKFDTDRIRTGFKFGAQSANITETEEEARQVSQIPALRLGQPQEFGNACAFLCSQHAGYITGQNLLIDGGLHKRAF